MRASLENQSSTTFCTLHMVPVPLLQVSTVYILIVRRYSHECDSIFTQGCWYLNSTLCCPPSRGDSYLTPLQRVPIHFIGSSEHAHRHFRHVFFFILTLNWAGHCSLMRPAQECVPYLGTLGLWSWAGHVQVSEVLKVVPYVNKYRPSPESFVAVLID